MPLVSVIIVCLNGRAHLPRAVESVLNQTFSDIELIVMDGASNDGTSDYLRSLHDERLVWRSEPDGGITQAWNKAVALTRGDWLLFLGADDYIWDKEVITKAAPFLRDSIAALAFGEVFIVAKHNDEVVQSVKFDLAALLAHLSGPNGLGLPHQGFFHHRRAFETGLFDPTFRLSADYEFITRFTAPQDFQSLPIGPVTAFRMGGLSTSPWVSVETYREVTRVYRLRGRSTTRLIWQVAKAHAKIVLKRILGFGIALHLVNFSRIIRNLPPYSE